MPSDMLRKRVAIEAAVITSVLGPMIMVMFNRFFQGRAVEATKSSISTVTISDDRIRGTIRSVALVKAPSGKLATGFVLLPRFVVTTANVVPVGKKPFVVVRGRGTVDEIVDTASVFLEDSVNQILVLDLGREVRADSLELRQADVSVLDKVFTIAYGWGDFVSVPEGRIANTAYRTDDGRSVIVANLAIYPGIAGGPFFDNYGRLIGMINSAIENSSIVYLTPMARIQHLLEKGKER